MEFEKLYPEEELLAVTVGRRVTTQSKLRPKADFIETQIRTRLYSPRSHLGDGNKLIIALKVCGKCWWYAIQTASMDIIIKVL